FPEPDGSGATLLPLLPWATDYVFAYCNRAYGVQAAAMRGLRTDSRESKIDVQDTAQKIAQTQISSSRNSLTNHFTPIFTDGSKIPGALGVGCAFYCPEDDHHSSRALSPLASIFSAECHAINDALDYITHLADDRKYIIMSDSLSALMSLQSLNIGVKTNHVILDIKERLSALSHGSVSLTWIPSHIGIGGNETVDALARAATESPPAASPPVNFTDLAESFRRDCFTTSIAKCEADGRHKGKIYFDLFHRHEKSTPWFTGKNLPRSMIVTINRIRSNHHSLAESLHRKNIIDNPGCACGSEEESLNHVLWNCGRYERQRRALWMELARLGLSAPLNAENTHCRTPLLSLAMIGATSLPRLKRRPPLPPPSRAVRAELYKPARRAAAAIRSRALALSTSPGPSGEVRHSYLESPRPKRRVLSRVPGKYVVQWIVEGTISSESARISSEYPFNKSQTINLLVHATMRQFGFVVCVNTIRNIPIHNMFDCYGKKFCQILPALRHLADVTISFTSQEIIDCKIVNDNPHHHTIHTFYSNAFPLLCKSCAMLGHETKTKRKERRKTICIAAPRAAKTEQYYCSYTCSSYTDTKTQIPESRCHSHCHRYIFLSFSFDPRCIIHIPYCCFYYYTASPICHCGYQPKLSIFPLDETVRALRELFDMCSCARICPFEKLISAGRHLRSESTVSHERHEHVRSTSIAHGCSNAIVQSLFILQRLRRKSKILVTWLLQRKGGKESEANGIYTPDSSSSASEKLCGTYLTGYVLRGLDCSVASCGTRACKAYHSQINLRANRVCSRCPQLKARARAHNVVFIYNVPSVASRVATKTLQDSLLILFCYLCYILSHIWRSRQLMRLRICCYLGMNSGFYDDDDRTRCPLCVAPYILQRCEAAVAAAASARLRRDLRARLARAIVVRGGWSLAICGSRCGGEAIRAASLIDRFLRRTPCSEDYRIDENYLLRENTQGKSSRSRIGSDEIFNSVAYTPFCLRRVYMRAKPFRPTTPLSDNSPPPRLYIREVSIIFKYKRKKKSNFYNFVCNFEEKSTKNCFNVNHQVYVCTWRNYFSKARMHKYTLAHTVKRKSSSSPSAIMARELRAAPEARIIIFCLSCSTLICLNVLAALAEVKIHEGPPGPPSAKYKRGSVIKSFTRFRSMHTDSRAPNSRSEACWKCKQTSAEGYESWLNERNEPIEKAARREDARAKLCAELNYPYSNSRSCAAHEPRKEISCTRGQLARARTDVNETVIFSTFTENIHDVSMKK
ncbi:unnamed protein product, partial [Trichogramma brassicae]